MNLFDDLPEPACRRNVPLAPLTWFKLGGPAEYLVEPQSEQQLATVLRRCHETGTLVHILGLGANVLVPDEGVSGVVVRLNSPAFTEVTFEEGTLNVGGGMDMTKLVRTCVRQGMAGLEQLAGIPGTVGGGICMNCGGRYGEIATAILRVRVMRPDGKIEERRQEELSFDYRRCNLDDGFVVSAAFQLHETDPEQLRERFHEIWTYKQNSQPAMGGQSVGCIFRNPNGQSAGQLIDLAGLKGFRVGSAYISERHANFAMSDKGGRSADVLNLIHTVADRVIERFGVRLEPEVKIW
ncbi:MAG: UDP-N-acetylmuramate dehydrogenase [Phycisphaerales bacterium]|nr:UDP-N-acetylmuramate dehydrogenase [Phycisphaerales bacterium]